MTDPGELAWIGTAYLVAGLIKGVTGLGFSTICLALLVIGLDLKDSLPLVLAPSLASNLMVMRAAGHFRSTALRFWPLYLALLPGLAVGLALLGSAEDRTAAGALGVVLAVYAGFALTGPPLALPARWERPAAMPAGLLTGLVNGVTGSQIMPVLPYLMAVGLDKDRFVQAINISFTLSTVVMAIGLAGLGLLTGGAAVVSIAGIAVVFAGVTLGTRLRAVLSPEAFRRAVLGLLLVLGTWQAAAALAAPL